MARGQSLQDPFLNTLRKERVPVSIYLVNGIKLQGQIDSFDQFVVLLKNSVSQMVYKHAISTVVPARAIRLPTSEEEGAESAVSEANERPSSAQVDRRVAECGGCLSVPAAANVLSWYASGWEVLRRKDELSEFEALARSAGAEVLGLVTGTRRAPDPRLFIGSGKAEEIHAQVEDQGADLVRVRSPAVAEPGAQSRSAAASVACSIAPA